MQFDPGLKEAVLRRTGRAWNEPGAQSTSEQAVLVRLAEPVEVPGLQVVARFGSVVTGRVELSRIAEVRADRAVRSLKASRPILPSLSRSVTEIGATQLHAGFGPLGIPVTGRGVLVGVIDWHCDFAHANFRRPDGHTRMRFLWDQRGEHLAQSPAPYGYGRLLNRDVIDAALAEPDPYAALHYDPARSDRTGTGSHGTHVLDIAAGNGRAPGSTGGVAPEAELAFVHLRGDDTREDDTLGDSVRLLEAVRLLVDEAGDLPVVINMSLGTHGGPHDGSTLVEMALDQILAERPGLAITMSTGNYFQSRTHADGVISRGETLQLKLPVSEFIERPIELEVWYSGEDEFVATLYAPSGRPILELPLRSEMRATGPRGVIASGYHRAHDPNNLDHVIDVFVWPGAEVGDWSLVIEGIWVTRGRLDAWIERDDRGAQSRFDLRQARSTGTTGTICNGRHTIAVGAYDFRQTPPAIMPFSSCGPTRDGRKKPDLSAPGGAIVAARSTIIDGGVRQMDGVTQKSGTSMAAPHVCGDIALVFEAAGSRRLPIEETRRIILGTLRAVPGDDPTTRMRYGQGLLDARAAVEQVRAIDTGGGLLTGVITTEELTQRPAIEADIEQALTWLEPRSRTLEPRFAIGGSDAGTCP